MKFLIDTQLPVRLAHHLTRLGHESKHTTFFAEGHLMDDQEIIRIAQKEERTIISKDSDFLDHFLLKGYPPKVLLLSLGNCSNPELFTLLEAYLAKILATFEEGNHLVIFSRDEILGYE